MKKALNHGGWAITEVIVEKGVTSIGSYAFRSCSSLTSVSIPDSVTSIGAYAFYDCSRLNYNTYGCGKYLGNENNKYSFLIDTTSTSITSFDFAIGVKIICDEAFYGCGKLTSVTIPDSVTSIGSGAFSSCSNLTAVNITNIEAWLNIDFPPVVADDFPGVTVSMSSSYMTNPLGYAKKLYLNGELVTELVIPDSITVIKDLAFYGCECLTSVTIPDSVTSIGSSAFSGCSSLTSITIPDSVTSIGYSAFRNCSSLTSITIPDGVTGIGSSAFYGCSELKSIIIPYGVTSIGNYAFPNCYSLTSVTMPESITNIGTQAFYGCSGLTSITIPDSVTSIGDSAFEGCSRLTSVNITNLKAWCEIDFDSIYSNPLYCADNLYLNGKLVTELIIPDGVTSIGKYVFCGCSSLTSVTVPDSITSIGNSAFYLCSSLTSISIPDSVTSIGNSAFHGCSALKDIYYCGSEDKWLDISIGNDNNYLYSATVHYLGFVASVEITSLPEKLEYIEGCEELDLTDGELTVTYADGSSSVLELTDGEITATGFDNSALGEQTITIMYRDYSASFKVNVVERKLGSVAFSVPNTKEYIQGEALKLEGGGITLHYTDGGTEAVALTLDMLSGYDTEKIGEQYVCISYKGDAVYYKITVYLNGDLDGDGTVASSDLALLRKTLLGISSGNRRYDVNGNGVIDIVDLVRIKKIAAD